jgi:hypothetical protein
MHNFAGLAMFAIAMSTIFLVDLVLHPIWDRFFPDDRLSHGSTL